MNDNNQDDYVVKVRRGRLQLVHKQIIRWRKKRKAMQAELKKLKSEVEAATSDTREEALAKNFFGVDEE